MKKHFLITLGALALAISAHAVTYSDADYFGTIHIGPGTNPPAGSPNGVHLIAGGGSASVSSTFNFAAPDATASFVIGTPYLMADRGTFTSVTGFVPGLQAIDSGTLNITLYFRDPSGGSEAYSFTSDDLSNGGGPITTRLVVHLNGGDTAIIDGDINADGILAYKVSATTGEFFVDAAYATMDAHTVPDGGSTVALLGFVLVGVEGLRRKLRMA